MEPYTEVGPNDSITAFIQILSQMLPQDRITVPSPEKHGWGSAFIIVAIILF